MLKSIRKKISQLHNTTRKQRLRIVFFFLLSVIVFLVIAYILFRTISTPSNAQKTKQRDEAAKAIKAERNASAAAPYVFQRIDLSQPSERYHIAIDTLSPRLLEPVECLVNSYTNEKSPTINIDSKRISDKKVLAFANEINNHEFSDEYTYYDIDDSIKVANKGEKSKHTVTFDSICKLKDVYFFTFNSYGEKTHIGGGGSAPSHFAFSDELGHLTILEKHASTHIDLSSVNLPDYDSLTSTTGIAYYGCREIYTANNLEVVIGCSGGDGPASAGGLFLLDLNNKESVEKVFCEYSSANKYATVCFNENGEVYYQELN